MFDILETQLNQTKIDVPIRATTYEKNPIRISDVYFIGVHEIDQFNFRFG
jgi:hypothetical protein